MRESLTSVSPMRHSDLTISAFSRFKRNGRLDHLFDRTMKLLVWLRHAPELCPHISPTIRSLCPVKDFFALLPGLGDRNCSDIAP